MIVLTFLHRAGRVGVDRVELTPLQLRLWKYISRLSSSTNLRNWPPIAAATRIRLRKSDQPLSRRGADLLKQSSSAKQPWKRGEYLTHEQVGERLGRLVQP